MISARLVYLHGELPGTATHQGDNIEDQQGNASIQEVLGGSIVTVSGVSTMIFVTSVSLAWPQYQHNYTTTTNTTDHTTPS